jgi:mRNA-degrading endonuclease RelE of RelBE toxin-antitoxin system
MSYKIITIKPFDRQAKRLMKKYSSLKSDLIKLISELQEAPTYGKALGNNCYKIRLAISSKGKGKSGGARVITNFHIEGDTIILLAIYDKSEQENISDKQILNLLQEIQ